MNDIEWTKDSTLTAQGQTTIPKFVREHVGLEPGDSIRFFPMDDHVQMMRVGRVIRALVARKELLVENSRRVTWAAYYCEREGYGFSDLMVLGAARDIDAVPAKTFDTQFSRHHQVSLLRTH